MNILVKLQNAERLRRMWIHFIYMYFRDVMPCDFNVFLEKYQSLFLFNFLIGRKLLYNIVLVSAVQQYKPVIIILVYENQYHLLVIYITSFLRFPPLPLSHPSRSSSQSIRLGSLHYTVTSYQLSV